MVPWAITFVLFSRRISWQQGQTIETLVTLNEPKMNYLMDVAWGLTPGRILLVQEGMHTLIHSLKGRLLTLH